MSPEQTQYLLKRIIYERVIDCIDFGALYELEHLLWAALETSGIAVAEVEEIASQMVGDALAELREDPRRSVTTAFGEPCDLCELQARPQAADAGGSKRPRGVQHGGVS